MRLSQWLRDEVWGARHWGDRLVALAHDLRASALTPLAADRALELAQACEAIVPSRSTAIEMYITAWKAAKAHPQALARARYLCREIGNLELAAKIAKLEFKHAKNPEYQLLEGLAWLDAQNPDRALRPLLAAAKANRSDPVVARALAIARREWTDVRGQIARLEDEARTAPDPREAADLLLDAARIAGMLATDETYSRLLVAAFHKNPLDESIHDLLMQRLGATRDYARLDDYVELWAGAAKSVQQRVDVYRRVGLDEALMSAHPELAARMVYEALRIAYRHAIQDIPSHLAMLGRLRAVLERSRGEDRFMAVIRIAFARDQSEDEKLWLAINGLDVAWNRLERAEEAQPYAETLRSQAPTHSVLRDYVSGGGFARAGAAAGLSNVMTAPPQPAPQHEVADVVRAPLVPEPSAASAPHLIPDPAVIDLSALGDGTGMPSIPLPPLASPAPTTVLSAPIDLPLPPSVESASPRHFPTENPSPTSAHEPPVVEQDALPWQQALPSAVAPPVDAGFLFEPVPPPLPPPAVDMDEEEAVLLDDDDLMLLDEDMVELVESASAIEVSAPAIEVSAPAIEVSASAIEVSASAIEEPAAPVAAPAPPPRKVPAAPPKKRSAVSEGAGPPPPPRSYAPGFAPPSKIPPIPMIKKPPGEKGR